MLAAITVTVAAVLGYPRLAPTKSLDIGNQLDLLKIILSVVAGIGAIVALVVAYRRQRLLERAAELDEGKERREIIRLFTERFTTIASQLRDDTPAVRLAGVYAMAGLADDWSLSGRPALMSSVHTCECLTCQSPIPRRSRSTVFHGSVNEVRHAVIRVIGSRLQEDSVVSWEGYYFDFRDVVFDGGDLQLARFSKGAVDFDRAVFQSGTIHFDGADFSGAHVSFQEAEFSGGEIMFTNARFSGSVVDFCKAKFCGSELWFDDAVVSDGSISFGDISFTGGEMHFNNAFTGGEVEFSTSKFSGGRLSIGASFEGGKVHFGGCDFSGVKIDCGGGAFFRKGSRLEFDYCSFSEVRPDFSNALWAGGEVRFRDPHDWAAPPIQGHSQVTLRSGRHAR